MFTTLLRRYNPSFVAVAILFALPALAEAGWMGFRNDTNLTIVIQENLPAGRMGKPQKLFMNESVRDTPVGGGQRNFAIYDSKNMDKPLYTGNFTCPGAKENLLYLIKSDAKGNITVDVVKTTVPGAGPVNPPNPKTPPTPPKRP